MPIVTPKRIRHLSRYFGVLGVLCFVGYWYTDYSYHFLAVLGPCFFLVHFLRHYGGVVVHLLPNDAVSNKIFLLFPVTILYFGLVGFHIKNILNERGKLRVIILLAFLGFLAYMHRLAFQELSLYWKGSEKMGGLTLFQSTDSSAGLNVPLGDKKGQGPVGGSREEHPF